MITHPARRRRLAFLAALAVVVVPVLTLGIAAPAEAFAPSPVKPKPPRMLSSEAQEVATTGAPNAGAAALAGARLANLTNVPAWNPITYLLQGNVVGAAVRSIGVLGTAAGLAAGVDWSGAVCSYATQNPTDLAASSGLLNEATGGSCVDANGAPEKSSIATGSQNLDAVSGKLGANVCSGTSGGGPNICLQLVKIVTYSDNSAYGDVCFTANQGVNNLGPAQYAFLFEKANGTFYRAPIGWTGQNPQSVSDDIKDCGFSGQATDHSYDGVITPQNGGPNPDIIAYGWNVNYGTTSFGAGLSVPVTTASSDPTRWLTCQITGTDGIAYLATSINFNEGSGAWPATKCPALPPGVGAGAKQVFLNGGPSVIDLTGAVQPSAAYTAAKSAYPLCQDSTCELHVYDPTGDCNAGDSSRCATWFTDPNKSTKYQCRYGTYTTSSLSECNLLANYYDPAKVNAGQAFADPATGSDPGGQTSPSTDQAVANATPTDDGKARACFPTGYGVFNPINWVVQPLQCVFMPRPSVIAADNNTITAGFNGSAIKGIQSVLISGNTFPGDGGCSGVPINIDMFVIHVHTSLLAACPGDFLAPSASLTKTVVTAVIITAGVLASLRYFAQIFGYSGLGSIIGRDNSDQRVNRGVKFK